MGGYDELFSAFLYDYVKDGPPTFVGGCGGASSAHIEALAQEVSVCLPRKLPEWPTSPGMQLSGLKPGLLRPEIGFGLAGERCNRMGSTNFRKLDVAFRWDEAVEDCVAQRSFRLLRTISRMNVLRTINMDYFSNSTGPVEECLRGSGLAKRSVVLAGGSNRLPRVRSMIQESFRARGPCKSINPDEAVLVPSATTRIQFTLHHSASPRCTSTARQFQ